MAQKHLPITRILEIERLKETDKDGLWTGKYLWKKPTPIEVVRHKRNKHGVPVYRGFDCRSLKQIQKNHLYQQQLEQRQALKSVMEESHANAS